MENNKHIRDCAGQSTVEAAFLIPVLLGCILLLVQPGIILYDRVVMNAAASQACRILATLPEGDPDGQCKEYVMRRLAAVPQQDCFHLHEGGCTWEVQCQGGQGSDCVSVSISTQVRPLPLLAFVAQAAGGTGASGAWTVAVEQSAPTQPGWVGSATSEDPSAWPGAWEQ